MDYIADTEKTSVTSVLVLENKGILLELDRTGYIISCRSKVKEGEFLSAPAPLVSAIKDDIEYYPEELTVPVPGCLLLDFGENGLIELKYETREYGIVFELTNIHGVFTRLTFTALKLNIRGVVGRSAGIVRGSNVAFGFQGLNRATDGGAKPLPGGSEIFGCGYGKDGFKGMRWCIFSCIPEEIMSNIEAIEKTEPGLPHLEINGKWIKAADAPRPHMIAPRRLPIEVGVEMVRKGGFDMLYLLPDTYESSGHYRISKDKVPGGAEGLRRITGQLEKFGAKLLMHSMSGQITANDPYVSPEPDLRLLRGGYATLNGDIDPDDKTIVFRNTDRNFLNAAKYLPGTNIEAGEDISGTSTLVIDKEIICPEKLVRKGDFVVAENCKRGVCHSSISSHASGTEVHTLVEYWSKGSFFPEPASDLPEEIADNLANTLKHCDAGMLALDGLEALSYGENPDEMNDRLMLEDSEAYNDPRLYCRSGSNRFAEQILKSSGLNLFVVSTVTHYNWHMIGSRGGGEITIDLRADLRTRINRNSWAKRNLLDVSMGSHDIRLYCERWGEATHPEDIDFICTRAAAADSAFDIFVYTTEHGRQDEMFETMRLWLEARRHRAFTPEQLAPYRNMDIDAKISRDSTGRFQLTPASQGKRHCIQVFGNPAELFNPYENQPARYSIQMLPAFDSEHPENIVLPVREEAIEPDIDQEVIPPSSLNLSSEAGSIRFSAIRNNQSDPHLARWICPFKNSLDFSRNRGLEVTLNVITPEIVFYAQLKDMHGMLRTYLWKLDSAGEHRLFLPNGEISTCDYHNYGPWGKYSPWFSAMKTVDYGFIAEAAFGFTGMQINKPCRIELKSVKAFREISDPLKNLKLNVNGEEVELGNELRPFDYLNILPEGKAIVYDANWNKLSETSLPSQTWKKGINTFTAVSSPENKHWMRLRPVFTGK